MCIGLGDSRTADIIAELHKFNFCHVEVTPGDYDEQISRLLEWLVKHLVRLVLVPYDI